MVTEDILKHMTMPNVNIKSATTVTKKSINILSVQTRIRKRKMTKKRQSHAKNANTVLKTCLKIRRRLRRTLLPYKVEDQISKRTNPTYLTHMERHRHIHYFYWRRTINGRNLKIIQPNGLSSKMTKIRDPYNKRWTWGQWCHLKMTLPWTYFVTQTWLEIKKLKWPLRIKSNGNEISVHKKANIPGYSKRVWISRRAITNIIDLKNLT